MQWLVSGSAGPGECVALELLQWTLEWYAQIYTTYLDVAKFSGGPPCLGDGLAQSTGLGAVGAFAWNCSEHEHWSDRLGACSIAVIISCEIECNRGIFSSLTSNKQ